MRIHLSHIIYSTTLLMCLHGALGWANAVENAPEVQASRQELEKATQEKQNLEKQLSRLQIQERLKLIIESENNKVLGFQKQYTELSAKLTLAAEADAEQMKALNNKAVQLVLEVDQAQEVAKTRDLATKMKLLQADATICKERSASKHWDELKLLQSNVERSSREFRSAVKPHLEVLGGESSWEAAVAAVHKFVHQLQQQLSLAKRNDQAPEICSNFEKLAAFINTRGILLDVRKAKEGLSALSSEIQSALADFDQSKRAVEFNRMIRERSRQVEGNVWSAISQTKASDAISLAEKGKHLFLILKQLVENNSDLVPASRSELLAQIQKDEAKLADSVTKHLTSLEDIFALVGQRAKIFYARSRNEADLSEVRRELRMPEKGKFICTMCDWKTLDEALAYDHLLQEKESLLPKKGR